MKALSSFNIRLNAKMLLLFVFGAWLLLTHHSCKPQKKITEQQKIAVSGYRILEATDSLIELNVFDKILEMDSANVNAKEMARVVIVSEDNDDSWTVISTWIAVLALAVSVLALVFSNRSFSLTRKSEITKEFLSMNSLDIEHPCLEWIYLENSKADLYIETAVKAEYFQIYGHALNEIENANDFVMLKENYYDSAAVYQLYIGYN